jgi:hypothetical protein
LNAQENKTETETKFPSKKGNLWLSKDNVKLNYLKNTEIRTDTIRVYNAWDKNMSLNFSLTKNYLECTASPGSLKPGQEGLIIVKYNATMKNDWGYVYENFNIVTNDTLEPSKSIFVMVYIEEDFSGLTKEDRDVAPKIAFEKEQFTFPKTKTGEKIKYSFKFKNEGKSDLIIRKTKASCGCTATEPEKSVLKPGESSSINIIFDTKNMTGHQHKTVYVYNNDPRYSTVALHIEGEVE